MTANIITLRPKREPRSQTIADAGPGDPFSIYAPGRKGPDLARLTICFGGAVIAIALGLGALWLIAWGLELGLRSLTALGAGA